MDAGYRVAATTPELASSEIACRRKFRQTKLTTDIAVFFEGGGPYMSLFDRNQRMSLPTKPTTLSGKSPRPGTGGITGAEVVLLHIRRKDEKPDPISRNPTSKRIEFNGFRWFD
ncbi:hypothetical protein LXL04_027859 [Taraxacum kok-saghyz]